MQIYVMLISLCLVIDTLEKQNHSKYHGIFQDKSQQYSVQPRKCLETLLPIWHEINQLVK